MHHNDIDTPHSHDILDRTHPRTAIRAKAIHVCSEIQLGAWSVAEMLRVGPGACKLRLTATNYSQLNAILGEMHIPKWSHFLKQNCICESAEAPAALFSPLPMPRGGSLPLLANSNTISLPSFLPPSLLVLFFHLPPPSGAGGKRIASGRGLLFVTHRNPATRRRVSRSTGSACRTVTCTLSEKRALRRKHSSESERFC